MAHRIPLYKIPLPVYKPSRNSFLHELPRDAYLYDAAIKYPIYKRLPECWRKVYEQDMPLIQQIPKTGVPKPHSRGLWTVGKDGQPERVENFPIRIYYPPESKKGIWLGEGYIKGQRYARGGDKMAPRYNKTWKICIVKRTVYSEILDRHIESTFTPLALDKIDAAFGFDSFILQTDTKLLQEFGGKIKREMLLALARKDTDLYPNDPEKREKIYNKYKKYEIPEEEASWIGLTLHEAMHKQWDIEKQKGLHDPVPLLEVYTKQLKEKLRMDPGISEKEIANADSNIATFEVGEGGLKQRSSVS